MSYVFAPFDPRFTDNNPKSVSVGCACGCGASVTITWATVFVRGRIDFERDGVYAALRQAHREYHAEKSAAEQRPALPASEPLERTMQFRVNHEITVEKRDTTWNVCTTYGEFRYAEGSLIGCLLERMAADAANAVALRAAVDPVRSWYDGDGEIEPPPTDVDIACQAIVDLQRDRDEIVRLSADRRKQLSADWAVVIDIVAERLNALRNGLPQEAADADAAARLECLRAAFSAVHTRASAPKTTEPS